MTHSACTGNLTFLLTNRFALPQVVRDFARDSLRASGISGPNLREGHQKIVHAPHVTDRTHVCMGALWRLLRLTQVELDPRYRRFF